MEIKKAPTIPLTDQMHFPPLFPSTSHPKTTFETCEICVYISWGGLLELNSVYLEIYF